MTKKNSGNCVKCGVWRRSLHRDHIIPKFKGGPDTPDNIQLLCANCHEDKTVEDLTGWPLSPAARLAQAIAQTGKPCSDHRREAISAAHREKFRTDPEYAAQVLALANVPRTMTIRKCDECDVVSNSGGLGTHQKASGHRGYTVVGTRMSTHGEKK